MRVSRCLSLLRPIGPVVVGISLGFTLSLLSVSWVEEPCDLDPVVTLLQDDAAAARKPNSIFIGQEEHENFETRVLKYEQVQQPQSKKVFRAKYISTELGIRERLFVGILTSRTTLSTLAVAVNRTISHHLDSVVFFTGERDRKVPHGMFVVAHREEHHVWSMYQTIRYILDHFISEYDYFYLAQDDTYTQADRVKALVGHLSMDRLLYMGSPREFFGGQCLGIGQWDDHDK
ncbi:hypothetical protein NFI96_010647 [Prochilodus magdalenae]|nr:hypothetical protein NFI96_010647 [Prochilodus magdalenae]